MGKFALLIGVSEYKSFRNLASTIKDVEALQQVLENDNICNFDTVNTLKNPNRQDIENAMHELFDNRQRDDLLLFYFSGHGVTDPQSHLFFTTPETRKNEKGIIVPPSAVKARDLQEYMTKSRSERQVIILDCCYSGAFSKGLTAKGDETLIDLQQNLGGKGRAILTSSSSTQRSFESKNSGLSIYTKYLVEGIRTGAADLDEDGKISVEELYEYTKEKVQEESPAMTPQFLPVEQGYQIILACSPQDDPKLIYRKEVEQIIQESEEDIDFIKGKINEFYRYCLEIHRQELNLSEEEAKAIETEVMAPYQQRWEKLQEYETLFSKAVKRRFPIKQKDRCTLQRIQNRLSLRDEDIKRIEAKITLNLSQPKIELKSEVGVDYSTLQELLSQQKWEEADEETAEVMLQAAKQEEQGYLNFEDIENFPCVDLQTIDQLWVKYSYGHFGFSVQKQIYLACGAKADSRYPGDEIWYKFCKKAGWPAKVEPKTYLKLTFNISAPRGHLPVWHKYRATGFLVLNAWEIIFLTILSREDL